MDYFDEINSIDYMFLDAVAEPRNNQLSITIVAAKVADHEEETIVGKANPIYFDNASPRYEICFDKFYIAYQVTNESFATNDEEDEYTGNILRVYTKSTYLTYNEQHTIAYIHGKEMKHYCIICLNHVIDVIAFDEPIITKR